MGKEEGMIRFRTAEHHTVYLRNLYRNACAFFIGGGPSLLELDLDRLRRPGIVTFGVNNAATVFRPHIWTCMDAAQRFPRCVWLDPTILKLVPTSRREERIGHTADERVRDCPNVLFFRRNVDPIDYGSDTFLTQPTVNYGQAKQHGGGRCVSLASMRLMHELGFRLVFLLGVDFHMDPHDRHYAADQRKDAAACRRNNRRFRQIADRHCRLRPVLERHGMHVYNCNPRSRLVAYDYIPFEDAVVLAKRTRVLARNNWNSPSRQIRGMN